jgi:hypothetical protein
MTERRPGNAVFLCIVLFFAIGTAFHFIRLDSFLKDALVTPLYFLVPTGVGLFVFSLFGAHRKLCGLIGGLRLALLSAFLGFSLITLSYVELNNRWLLAALFDPAYYTFYLMSVYGFYRTREIWAEADVREGARCILVISPALALAYYFSYMHFSPFPLRDIFQETNYMRVGLEFSKYGVLNLATGDTFMPLLHVSSGLLHRFYRFDLINGQWILPVYFCVFISLCYYCFLSSFISDRAAIIAALGLVVGIQFLVVNNTFMVGLALVFFSLLVSLNKDMTRALPVFIELAVGVALSVLFFKFRSTPSYTGTILPHLLAFLALMLAAASLNAPRLLGHAVVVLVLMIAPPYHRAAAGYMPMMFFIYGAYFAFFRMEIKDALMVKKRLLKKVAIYTFLAPILGAGLGITLVSAFPSISGVPTDIFNFVSTAIIGGTETPNEDLAMVTAEWLRAVPFAAHGLFVLIAALLFLKRRDERVVKFVDDNINALLFASVSFLAIMVLFYSPLPHAHRFLPFPTLLFLAVVALLLSHYSREYFTKGGSRARALLVPAAVLVYTLVAQALYRIPLREGDESSYVRALSPLAGLLIGLMLVAFVTLIITRRKTVAVVLVLAIALTGVMFDRFNAMAKLYIVSFGGELPESGVISHYTPLELGTAERLDEMLDSPDTLLFSDPATLGIFEARTGINGLYSSADLGQFIHAHYTKALKAILRSTFPPLDDEAVARWEGGAGDVMHMLAGFVEEGRGASPEAVYALQTRLGMPYEISPQHVPTREAWAEIYRDKVIWILTEKTVRWAYGEDTRYYPMDAPFSQEYIEKYVIPKFHVLINAENRVLVLMPKRPPTIALTK